MNKLIIAIALVLSMSGLSWACSWGEPCCDNGIACKPPVTITQTNSQVNSPTITTTGGAATSSATGGAASTGAVTQSIQYAPIPSGLGRDFGPQTGLPDTRFVEPNKPDPGLSMFDVKYLPVFLTYNEAKRLRGGGSADVMAMVREPNFRLDDLKQGTDGELIGYVVGTSSKSIVEAWGAAYVRAMEWGATRVSVIKTGSESRPSAFFIGLGSAYTTSSLHGDALTQSNTAGGSGLIGYSTAFQNRKVGVVLSMYRTGPLVPKPDCVSEK